MSTIQNHNLTHILNQIKENKKYDTVNPIQADQDQENFQSYSTFLEIKPTESTEPTKPKSLFTILKNFILNIH